MDRHARAPFLPHNGLILAEVIRIDEVEVKKRRDEPLGGLLAIEPPQHLRDARQKPPQVRFVAAIAPVIVNHRYPYQRVQRRVLIQLRGEARLRQAEGRAGSIELFERLAIQRVVAGSRQPSQRL